MKNKTDYKFTSVYVLPILLDTFNLQSHISFKQFVNRSLDLYNNDKDFQNKINQNFNLVLSGSGL